MLDEKINAVVLAGGRASEEIMAATGHINRAMIPIGDLTMLELVVRALHGARSIGSIVVVGDDIPKSADYRLVESNGDLFANLQAGIAAATPRENNFVLVSTSDIPFLTPQSVDDFVGQARHRNAHLSYPIIPMDVYNQRFKEMKRTTLRLREGRFTGGNIMLLDTAFTARHGTQIAQAYAARKDVLKLGSLLGFGVLARILLSQTVAPNMLSVEMLEAAASKLLSGARVAAVITRYPEIGTDVDKVSDVEYARQHFGV